MKKLTILTGILALLVSAISAFSAGPNLMSYQGQILTSGGAPIANGSYPAKFEFFSASVGGSSLWSETGSITTSTGLFTHTLGSITAIPTSIFVSNPDVWLEVTVNGQLQSPRNQLTSAGNSITTGTVDGAMGGTIRSSIGVGDPSVSSGSVGVYSSAAPFATGSFYDQPGFGAGIQLWDESGFLTGVMEPDFDGIGGFIAVVNGFSSTAFAVDGNYLGSGNPYIYMGGLSTVSFDLNTVSNNSVLLPDSAIAAPEILDEPGIVTTNYPSYVILPYGGVMTDIVTVTITIPAPGYIDLTGVIRYLQLNGTTGANWAFCQIDETAGGGTASGYYTVAGASNFPTAQFYFFPAVCHRVYYKSTAGTYTFRLEGMAAFGTPTVCQAWNSDLTATYYPTSYGSNVLIVSSSEARQFDNAELVNDAASPASPESGSEQMYKVDVRELELKVAKAEAETQKARTALAEARLKEQMNSKPATAVDKK